TVFSTVITSRLHGHFHSSTKILTVFGMNNTEEALKAHIAARCKTKEFLGLFCSPNMTRAHIQVPKYRPSGISRQTQPILAFEQCTVSIAVLQCIDKDLPQQP